MAFKATGKQQTANGKRQTPNARHKCALCQGPETCWISAHLRILKPFDSQDWSVRTFSSQFQWNISQTCIENEEYHQLKRCGLDITPNFYDYPTKKSIAPVGRINVSIVGMKGLIKQLLKKERNIKTSSNLLIAVSRKRDVKSLRCQNLSSSFFEFEPYWA